MTSLSSNAGFALDQKFTSTKMISNQNQIIFTGVCAAGSEITIQDQTETLTTNCQNGSWSWTSVSSTGGLRTYSFTQNNVSLSMRVLRNFSLNGSFAEGATDSDDIFVFTMGSQLMLVQNPFHATDFTGTSIFSESNPIQAVALNPSGRQAYYVMGGNLYCYAFSNLDENDNCRNRRADAHTLQATNIQMHGVLAQISGTADKAEWIAPSTINVQSQGIVISSYQIPKPTLITQNLKVGVNIKMNGDAYQMGADAIFKKLSDNGFKSARLFLGIPPLTATQTFNDTVGYLRTYVTAAQKYGIQIYLNYQVEWIVCPSDSFTFQTQDQNAIYQSAYQTTQAFVDHFKNDIVEWELGNELDLKSGTSNSPGGWPYGFQAADWDQVSAHGSSDYYGNFAAALKGASDAINAVNTASGTHMKRIVNSTGTHLGLWKFLISKNVQFDEISYHYYQTSGTSAYAYATTDPNYPGSQAWNVVGSLAQFNKPVQITEFNCGEIYNDSFQNTSSDPLYAQCLKSLKVQLNYWTKQTVFDLSAIYAYELFDEPSQPDIHEKHFGLFYALNDGSTSPKSTLSIWQSLAGITLTQAQIDDLKGYNVWPLF